MKEFKIRIQEKVSVWRELDMIVESEDLSSLKKEIELDDLNIIDIHQVDYFDETTTHLEYDMEYCDIEELTEEEDNAILGSV
jgi:hypothetical protein